MSAAALQPPSGFDDYFGSFLARLLDLRAPALPQRGLDMPRWSQETTRMLRVAGTRYWLERREHETRLESALASTARQVDATTLVPYVQSRLRVLPVPDLRTHGERDLFYIKINHGFWEQLYAIFGPPDPTRMRIEDPSPFVRQYVQSAFVDALRASLASIAAEMPHLSRARGVHLAISLGHGGAPHAHVLQRFESRDGSRQTIAMGAAIGLIGWWSSTFPQTELTFDDGCLPKTAIFSGELAQLLDWASRSSDRILFAVPSHLMQVRLAASSVRQETVLIPSSGVHESWLPCLYETARHVLARVTTGERVLVLTQSAVFSALLGAFLAEAKRELLPTTGLLRFLDLGQVLDVATPSTGGRWVRTVSSPRENPFALETPIDE